MGYSRKEEIAKLRRERKEAKAAKKRKEYVREKFVRFLIVCEGTKTEPHYFEALINNYISAVREVTIEGEGRATVALVDGRINMYAEADYREGTTAYMWICHKIKECAERIRKREREKISIYAQAGTPKHLT